MFQRLFGFVALLIALLSAPGPGLAGVDEAYLKPAGKKSWGELLADFIGHRGFGRSYALVVGISDFEYFSSLPTANDPLRMRDFLIDEAGFDYVHVLTGEKATAARINELMQDILPAMIDENDQFLFYWSGHGETRARPQGGFLGYLPLASSPKGAYSTMVSMKDIQDWDELLEAKQALFLLDACFSGLAGHRSQAGDRDLQIDQLAKPAHHLVSAGTGDEQTIAGDRWGGSIFTDAILRAVRGEADAATSYPQDGVVSLTELVGYLKTRVAFEASRSGWTKSITPQPRDLRTSDGEFFFLTNESKVAKLEGAGGKYQDRFENGVPVVVMGSAPPPACDRDADRLFWEAIKNETAPRYFEAYLRRVASGELCGLFAEVAHLKSEANIAALPSATGSKPERPAEPDPAIDEAALNLRPEHRRTIQQALTAIGLYADGIDGIFGANTRQAIASWQRDKNEKPTGYLTAPQYGQLLAEAEPKRAALESARQESERTSPSSRPSARAQFGKPGDGGLKSGSSTTEVFVKFVNVTEQTISIYWIDFQGQEKIYYRLRPNAEYVQQTYTTHVWIAKDPLGEILSTFVANDGDLQPTVVVR